MSVFNHDLVSIDPYTGEDHICRLCYVYINRYKGVKDVEIIIDPNYACHYDREGRVLSIEKSFVIPKYFWGDGIHSVAAIVGNNGVGKSTAVEFILSAIVAGASEDDINGILVYEKGGKVLVYSNNRIRLPGWVESIDAPEKICCLYYNGHFVPELLSDNLRFGELAENYNISTGFLLLKDVQNYSNTDYFQGGISFEERLSQYNAQNHMRICKMLANRALYERIEEFVLPKYILIKPNRSGYYLKEEYNRTVSASGDVVKQTIPDIVYKTRDWEEIVFTNHIYCNFLNFLFNESHRDVDDGILQCLNDWQAYLSDSGPVLEQFDEFVSDRVEDYALKRSFRSVHEALTELDRLASFYHTPIWGCHYLDVGKEHDSISGICRVLEKSYYLVAQYFDIQYSQDLGSGTVLSSGEQSLLDLFSRLYATIQTDPIKFQNLDAPALLILDEAEHSFHPEWQRRYIYLLLHFLQQLVFNSDLKFQILLTTHSPVLLSDIPKNSITFLKKEGGAVNNVFPEMAGTFASNIFDVYRSSFFMDQGMIGEFAMEKLRSLESRVKEADNLGKEAFNNLMHEINLIGDIRIREYLLNCIPESKKRDEMSYLRARLHELEKRESNE